MILKITTNENAYLVLTCTFLKWEYGAPARAEYSGITASIRYKSKSIEMSWFACSTLVFAGVSKGNYM